MSGASLSLAARIDARCDEFERAWTPDGPPQIEAFVAGWAGRERELLVLELAAVDAECRLAAPGD